MRLDKGNQVHESNLPSATLYGTYLDKTPSCFTSIFDLFPDSPLYIKLRSTELAKLVGLLVRLNEYHNPTLRSGISIQYRCDVLEDYCLPR
jgi:hypothetical protein